MSLRTLSVVTLVFALASTARAQGIDALDLTPPTPSKDDAAKKKAKKKPAPPPSASPEVKKPAAAAAAGDLDLAGPPIAAPKPAPAAPAAAAKDLPPLSPPPAAPWVAPAAPAAGPPKDLALPGAGDLELPKGAQAGAKGKGAPALTEIKDMSLDFGPGPDLSFDLDLDYLKSLSLCVLPFVKEDRSGTGASAAALGKVQDIFVRIGEKSPLLKGATVVSESAEPCVTPTSAAPSADLALPGEKPASANDAENLCLARIGQSHNCSAVLAGKTGRLTNGFMLHAALVDVATKKAKGRVDHVVETAENTPPAEIDARLTAWAEGLACRALKVDCASKVIIEGDRPEMVLLWNSRPLDRKLTPTGPVRLSTLPGIHKVGVKIGGRSSEAMVVLARNQSPTVYARQSKDGGLKLTVCADRSCRPPPASEEFAGGTKWTKPVGYVLAGLGVVAAGFSGQQYLHSKSLVSDANAAYTANGGAYYLKDTDKLSSARSSLNNSNIAAIAAAVLVVGGLTMVLAF